MQDTIPGFIELLRAKGAKGLDQYAKRLQDNAKITSNLCDLLFEGRAALLFLYHGFRVTLRESPDLQVKLDGEVAYAEVKHFQEKEQDQLDEKAMCETTDLLVPIGDTTASEGTPAWKQIVNVAISKRTQYVSDAPNILIIESSSESLSMMLSTAVNEYDAEALRSDDPSLRALNAFMLISATGWVSLRGGRRSNIEFCQTAHAATPMSDKLVNALADMHLG